jgi:hypothetical protein
LLVPIWILHWKSNPISVCNGSSRANILIWLLIGTKILGLDSDSAKLYNSKYDNEIKMFSCDEFYFVSEPKPKLVDLWSTGHDSPDTDSKQNLELTQFEKKKQGYKFRFRRLLDTGDSDDRVLEENQNYTFSFCYSSKEDGFFLKLIDVFRYGGS